MTKTLDEPVALSYPTSKLPDGLEGVLRNEFSELCKCSKVDCRFLWKEGEKSHYRVNGWKLDNDRCVNDAVIIFSIFVIAWDSEKGIQYKVSERT